MPLIAHVAILNLGEIHRSGLVRVRVHLMPVPIHDYHSLLLMMSLYLHFNCVNVQMSRALDLHAL